MDQAAEVTDLYRYFDSWSRLLYVGISSSALVRMGAHEDGSKWFQFVWVMTIEKFPTRRAALIAERAAIKSEKPIFNVVHASPAGLEGEPHRIMQRYQEEAVRDGY